MSLTDQINAFVEAAKDLKVAVIGETIIDEFIPVTYEGQSMKSFCSVLRLEGEKTEQIGGAGAIAGHLKDFVANVDLFTNSGKEIVKTRYVDVNDNQKHIEINKFDVHEFNGLTVDSSNYDVVIVADFGHGFCNNLDIADGFHLMCQTNSNNFGFNRVSKWKKSRKRSVCLDLREASLHMNHKMFMQDPNEIKELFEYELNTDLVFLTMGRSGAVSTDGENVFQQQVYPSEIVDTIGAGDTFFAFSSVAAQIVEDKSEMMMIPALAASLSTTWLCNEQSVTKEKLNQHAARFV